jgi:hypothetical protein
MGQAKNRGSLRERIAQAQQEKLEGAYHYRRS